MELSVEEKAQRYDEAIEQLKAMMPKWERLSYNGKTFLQDLTYILPELKENEDEMIRRVLIQETKGSEVRLFEAVTNEEFIAWLEKKGGQKPTDNAEPKFKVGDWVVSKLDGKVRQILGVHHDKYNNYYVVEDNEYNIKEYDRLHHHWTIQNAKDGDVLSSNDGHGNDCIELIKSITGKKIEFWFCLTNGNSYEVFDGILPYTNLASRKDATPATKEQRDLLFAKIKEAGYKWNEIKKELKKIEDEPDVCEGCNNAKGCVACVDGSEWAHIEEKSFWSEEDERMFKSALWHIKNSCGNGGKNSGEFEVYNWLKSIKGRVQPQSQWKPSDEQIIAIQESIGIVGELTPRGECLKELEEQLKKLKG